MDTIIHTSSGIRYSARSTAKPVNFFCQAPRAQAVRLVGDFNQWNPSSHPMRRQVDGCWFLQVMVTHGHHQYLFLVDGQPTLDPRAAGTALNEQQEEVSIVAVS
jgi:1,4-alpha-glucan branching enzyme